MTVKQEVVKQNEAGEREKVFHFSSWKVKVIPQRQTE
jgi:hypothetical protein